LKFRGVDVQMTEAEFEPASVNWVNCVPTPLSVKVKRMAVGALALGSAMGIWIFAFYAPYAYFIMSFNYAYGQEPGMVASIAFTMVVVVGNGLMYFICSEIADRMCFQIVDNREVCYMLLYSFACMTNVLLDMVVTYFMAYEMMVGVGMKTYNGEPLSEVKTFTERFETYAMQRELGRNLMAYSWPSTFLVPFLIEPFATIYLPFKLLTFIVRSHRSIKAYDAEKFLTPFPMDLSRYADVLLNVMLVALVFFFPGGFTHRMFWALAVSHMVIYLCDQYKVLRCIPSCYFASMDVDWWAQWMLSIPCALILTSVVFKVNCTEGVYCYSQWHLIGLCFAAFLLHIMLHTWVLVSLVPALVKPKASAVNDVPYKKCARAHACSWFSANPVYCVRTQYLYNHFPPCDMYVIGKEHLLRRNPDLNLWFKDTEAEVEDYAGPPNIADSIRSEFNSMKAGIRQKGISGIFHDWQTDRQDVTQVDFVQYDDTPKSPARELKADKSRRTRSEPPVGRPLREEDSDASSRSSRYSRSNTSRSRSRGSRTPSSSRPPSRPTSPTRNLRRSSTDAIDG